MARSIPVHEKRGRGRPAGANFTQAVPVRLAPDVLDAVDRFAKAEGLTRSEVIRAAVADYLKRKPPRPKGRRAGTKPSGGKLQAGRKRQPPLVANPDEVKGG